MRKSSLIVAVAATSCVVQNRGIDEVSNEFCEAANDIAVVMCQACVGAIPQPPLEYPESALQVESWIGFTYADDRAIVVTARSACVPPRPWEVLPRDMELDCETLRTCMASEGVVFPDPWPSEDFRTAQFASECFDPAAVSEDDDGDGDPD